MIWPVLYATKIWKKQFCCHASTFFISNVLGNGLSRIWTIFVQSASMSSTLIKSRIFMSKRKSKPLLIEWELLFSNKSKTRMLKGHRAIAIKNNHKDSHILTMKSRFRKEKKNQFSTLIVRKRLTGSMKKDKSQVNPIDFINNRLSFSKFTNGRESLEWGTKGSRNKTSK